MKVTIVAFTGLPMTGKSTAREITEELLTKKDIAWERVYFGGVVIDEVEKRNQSNDWSEGQESWSQQEKEKWVREELRAREGLGIIAKRCLPQIDKAAKDNKVVLIDDLYSEEERQILIDKYGEKALTLVTLAADWPVRVRRGKNRAVRPLTEDELQARDNAEIFNLHKAPPIALAHFTIVNNHDEQEAKGVGRKNLAKEIESRVLPNIVE